MKVKLVEKEEETFKIDKEGIVRYEGRIWVAAVQDLKEEILHEAHHLRYVIHPRSTKMYRDLRQHFWWPGMKRDIAEWVGKCLTCQKVKTEHQKPSGLL